MRLNPVTVKPHYADELLMRLKEEGILDQESTGFVEKIIVHLIILKYWLLHAVAVIVHITLITAAIFRLISSIDLI